MFKYSYVHNFKDSYLGDSQYFINIGFFMMTINSYVLRNRFYFFYLNYNNKYVVGNRTNILINKIQCNDNTIGAKNKLYLN